MMSNEHASGRQDMAYRALVKLMPEIPLSEEQATIAYFEGSSLPLDAVVLALFDQSDDCIKVIDRDGRLAFMNCNGKKVMQIDDFQKVRNLRWRDLWPEAARPMIDQAILDAEHGRTSRFEGDCPTAKGVAKRWEVTVSPVRNPAGQPIAYISTSRDISDRVAQPA